MQRGANEGFAGDVLHGICVGAGCGQSVDNLRIYFVVDARGAIEDAMLVRVIKAFTVTLSF